MELYKLLSENYEQLFPISPREISFLEEKLAGKTHLLDIGCGTGDKTERLSGARRVVGVDASPEMIAIANAKHSGPAVGYLRLGMEELSGQFPPDSFDSAICVGNTMAHLSHPGEVLDFLRRVRELLQPGGVFIAQIINFDRIISQRIDSLPVIETDAVVFRRFYRWDGPEMSFCIELEDKKTGVSERRETPMRPILKSALESALHTAGFLDVEYFGSYSGEPYREDSYHLIFKTSQVNA